jgi:hypothetical protein
MAKGVVFKSKDGLEVNVEEVGSDIKITIDTKPFIFPKEYIGTLYDNHPIRKIYNEWKRNNIYDIIEDKTKKGS